MAFGTKTWSVGNAWPVTDANTYIRDALNSLRNYQNSQQLFRDTHSALGNTFTTVATHLTLLTATPDESYDMQVLVFLLAKNPSGAGTVDVKILDQASADITLLAGGWAEIGPGLAGAATYAPTITAGKGSYTTGTNAGITVQAKTNAGTCDVDLSTFVTFRPTP